MNDDTSWIDGKTTTQPSASTTTRGDHERSLAQLRRSVDDANRAARIHAAQAAHAEHVELRRTVDSLRAQHADAIEEEKKRQTASDAADGELRARENTHAKAPSDTSWRAVERATALTHRRSIELRGVKAKVADLDARLRAAQQRLALHVYEEFRKIAARFSIDPEVKSALAAFATFLALIKSIDAKLAVNSANVDEMEAARAAAGIGSPGCARLAGGAGCALTLGVTTSSCSTCPRVTRGRAMYLVQHAIRMLAVGKSEEEALRIFDVANWVTPWSGAIAK